MIRRRRIRFYGKECRDIFALMIKGRLAEGPYVEFFEERFSSYIGREFAVSTCSGRNGMELLFDAMGFIEGDEIIVPAYTLKDLLRLMELKKLKPVLADVEESTYNIDPGSLAKKITPRTRAVMATHIFGVPCDIEKIVAIAREHGLKVIEDCAHAIGAEYKGKKLGSFGDAAFFSFEMTKLVNTFGGGMVVTGDSAIAGRIRRAVEKYPRTARGVLKKILFLYMEHLIMQGPFFPVFIRIFTSNIRIFSRLYRALHSGTRVEYSRYSNVQAFIGIKQMESLEENNRSRAETAKRLAAMLDDGIIPQEAPAAGERVFYFYVVKLLTGKPLEQVRREMLSHGVDTGIGAEITDNCSLTTGDKDEYPVVSELFEKNLQLPMYDGLKEKETVRIARALNTVCSSRSGGDNT